MLRLVLAAAALWAETIGIGLMNPPEHVEQEGLTLMNPPEEQEVKVKSKGLDREGSPVTVLVLGRSQFVIDELCGPSNKIFCASSRKFYNKLGCWYQSPLSTLNGPPGALQE